MTRITKEQASAFRKRWQVINELEIRELRRTTMEEKLGKTAVLMASVESMGWSDPDHQEEAEVWERWRRLREIYGG
ncbi:hypothetical protein GWO43_10275 [candidate division KSB1 bacterium]|nr:hypothetical protein [candidate division KSB1 bacterium]NIR69683.1 hypothetical protein [candidate division KSB1 bacterium]NIS24333.1 hypothetical protein [candidate division KSB1 bacterium]NIT71261.1 hypothetical protein [candidate division KSB1 bacterium]NIU24967.1 hypothetical protein [candidate division KSB1 bacterium]